MKLPNLDKAIVQPAKITRYLLEPSHPENKAEFFMRFGFRPDDWQQLAEALLQHAAENDVTKVEASPHGTRYVVEGGMLSPSGRTLGIRSVWFLDAGSDIPRLVTAYPTKRRG